MLTNENDANNLIIDTTTNEESVNIDVDLDEQCIWLKNDKENVENDISELVSWILIGNQNESLKYRTTFCSSELVNNIDILENELSKFTAEQIDAARIRCNPLENLKRLFFVNRSAVKCANLDSLINLTNQSNENYLPAIDSTELLLMADIDGPEGGFVDYMLWRTGWRTKVYACVENKLRIERFSTIPESLETFKSHIVGLTAISTFNKYVRQSVKRRDGVHLVTCDGSPHSFNCNEFGKELTMKPFLVLYTCYALSLLRENGIFLLKLFEIFTPFTVGLIYLLHKCFKEITIIKPAYSRPTNSERYLICKYKLRNTQTILEHLLNIYEAMTNLNKNQSEVIQLVPIDVLKADDMFFQYIFERNNSIVKKQLFAMNILKKYLNNENLECTTKDEYRLKCLQLWNLPESFEKPMVIDAEIYCNRLLNLEDTNDTMITNELIVVDQLLTNPSDLENIFVDLENWYFVPASIINNNTERCFFLSQGGNNVYMYQNNNWKIVPDRINLSLPARTLVYAEITTDIYSSGHGYRETFGLHIIDGLFLGGTDIRNMKLLERNQICQNFAKSINCRYVKDSNYKKAEKYCKLLNPITNLIDYIDGANRCWRYCGQDDEKHIVHYIPHWTTLQEYYRLNGILFFNSNISDPSGICAPVLWNWHLNNNLFNLLNNPLQFIEQRSDNVYLAQFKQFLFDKEMKL